MDKIYDYDSKTDVSTLMNCVKYARSMDQILECCFPYDNDNTGKVFFSVCENKKKSIGREFLYPPDNGLFVLR